MIGLFFGVRDIFFNVITHFCCMNINGQYNEDDAIFVHVSTKCSEKYMQNCDIN